MTISNTAIILSLAIFCASIVYIFAAESAKKHERATRIQALARGYLARKQIKQASNAACKIQTKWRRYSAIKKNESATRIQAVVRAYIARKELQRSIAAAQKIQAAWRVHHVKKVESATRIQAVWRGSSALSKFRRTQASATRIQAAWRLHALNKLESAATIIQARVRSFLACRQVEVRRVSQSYTVFSWKEACKIVLTALASFVLWPLAWFQACREKKQQEERLCLETSSALLIQAVWRGRVVRMDLERKALASCLIQTRWRGFVQRKKYQLRLKKVKRQRKIRKSQEFPVHRPLFHALHALISRGRE